MNRFYLAAGVLLAFALAIGGAVHEHDVRVRADERAAIAAHHADSVDAVLLPRERALADTIAALHRASARDSAAAAAAITDWTRIAHPAKVVVRVDTLPGHVDTVFADAVPSLPAVIHAGDAAAERCTAAAISCAQRAVALERDTALMHDRIAALEGAKGSVAPARSCTGPALLGAVLGGAIGGVGGFAAGARRPP